MYIVTLSLKRRMHIPLKYIALVTMLCGCTTLVMGQRHHWPKWALTKNDTSYVEDHSREFTFRLYESRKYGAFAVHERGGNQKFRYFSNTPFNIGVGANYRTFALNLGFNFPFINNGLKERYGKPKYLDLQTHIYLRRWIADIYLQYYKSYYLVNPGGTVKDYVEDGQHARRPDIQSIAAGGTITYIDNDEKFSYRANSIQVDWQKKSAGSWMAAVSTMFVNVHGDSSLVPANMKDEGYLSTRPYDRTGHWQIAAGGGYGYTFVYRQHFFATLVAQVGVGINTGATQFSDGVRERGTGFGWNTNIRAAIGYNSARYFAGIHWENFGLHNSVAAVNAYETYGTGNLRVSIARRFLVKRQRKG